MAKEKGIRKVCPKGHVFFKSSNCLSCPECEISNRPESGILSMVSAPARRALRQHELTTLQQLSKKSKAQLLELHGVGPSAVKVIISELNKIGLHLKDVQHTSTNKPLKSAPGVREKKLAKPTTVDAYIANFPEETQKLLTLLRVCIKKLIPEVEEKISYGMPGYFCRGKYVIYFAAHKNHIGIYPVPSGKPEFDALFSAYTTSGKGTLQLPLNKPLPKAIIEKIILHRLSVLAKEK